MKSCQRKIKETMTDADCAKSVLFVCLGKPIFCDNFMSEQKRGLLDKWVVDSAAIIDFHVGKAPDKRTMAILAEHGVTDYKHKVRQVTIADFHNFDYIFGMDEKNIQDLKNLRGNVKGKAVIGYLGSYDPEGILIIPDPYYSRGMQMFNKCSWTSLPYTYLQEMPAFDSRIMYLIMRSDLITDLKWSVGAVAAQAAHAATACIWTFREDSEVMEYMKDISHLRKVTLKVLNESELRNLEKKLQDCNVDYYLWTEDRMAEVPGTSFFVPKRTVTEDGMHKKATTTTVAAPTANGTPTRSTVRKDVRVDNGASAFGWLPVYTAKNEESRLVISSSRLALFLRYENETEKTLQQHVKMLRDFDLVIEVTDSLTEL
ncbi:Low molecular weight phosphotyrosine protein phosphatase [Dirofilaria immitis]|nr:Low molecular weight phosphotyrosine protein phosphatase [Dirofilaria immitis]